MRQEYSAAISYWAKKVADKNYFLGSLIEDTYMPSPPCPVAEAADLSAKSLGVDSFFAPLMIYVVLVCIALASRVFFTARKHKGSFRMPLSFRRRKSVEKPPTSIEAPPSSKSPGDELPPVPERAQA